MMAKSLAELTVQRRAAAAVDVGDGNGHVGLVVKLRDLQILCMTKTGFLDTRHLTLEILLLATSQVRDVDQTSRPIKSRSQAKSAAAGYPPAQRFPGLDGRGEIRSKRAKKLWSTVHNRIMPLGEDLESGKATSLKH